MDLLKFDMNRDRDIITLSDVKWLISFAKDLGIAAMINPLNTNYKEIDALYAAVVQEATS